MAETGNVDAPVSFIAEWRNKLSKAYQTILDEPHYIRRWLWTFVVAMIYVLRVYYVQGFYVVSYGLGTYVLNLLIGICSPKDDPAHEALERVSASPPPTIKSVGFKCRISEVEFWHAITKAFIVASVLTFISILDVPVFWPILLCYWNVLFVLTVIRQVKHMIRYNYVPWNRGEQGNADESSPAAASQADTDENSPLTASIPDEISTTTASQRDIEDRSPATASTSSRRD